MSTKVTKSDVEGALDQLEKLSKSNTPDEGGDSDKVEKEEKAGSKDSKKMKKSDAESDDKKDHQEPDGDEDGDDDSKEAFEGAAESKKAKKAKKMKKSEPSESDLGDEQDGMSKDHDEGEQVMGRKEGNKKGSGDAAKSEAADDEEGFADKLTKSEGIQKTLEVSDFLKSLVDTTASAIDEQNEIIKSLVEGREEGDAKLDLIVKSQGAIGVILKSITHRLGIIENSPARAAKSVLQKSDVQERFSEAEGKEIKKSQVLSTLFDLVKSGDAQDIDVIRYEQSNFLRPEVAAKVEARFSN